MVATVGALAQLVGGDVRGDADRAVDDLADLGSAGPRDMSFYVNPRYLYQFQQTRAAAVLVAQALPDAPCAQVVCTDPYLAMAHIASALHPAFVPAAGIDAAAHVHPEARIDAAACIGAGAIIERGAQIGPRSVVAAGAYVGPDSRLGEGCTLHPGARVLHRCRLGNRVILHAGAVVGSDGFGYAADAAGRRHKIPQVGIVQLDDDVEVGANSTIDRATFGVTRIGAGTKIDNLVQIAHNVVCGADCVVVSQTGIAGSTRLGDRVVIGAQAGLIGHIQVASDVTLGARAGVAASIPAAGTYSGTPAMPHRQWLKVAVAQQHVPELRRKVRGLEAQVALLDTPS